MASNAALMTPPQGTIAPRFARDGDAMKPSTLAKLSALSECEPDAVELPEANLLLDPQERAVLKARADALEQAQAELVAADQALAAAQHLSRQVSALRQQCGVAAAAGFSGRKVDAQLAQKAAADLAAAEQAALAEPELRAERDKAKTAATEAWGSLRVNSQTAVRNALHRQCQEYQRLARSLAHVAGHVAATIELLNSAELTSAGAYWMSELKVPAPPLVADTWAGIEEHDFRKMMVRHEHGAVTCACTAARGWLQRQIVDATGLPAQKLMIL